MNQEIERRNIEITELRVITNENKKPSIRGHAAVFNKLSEDLGGFREKIDPGTFKGTIKKDDIRALFNHDANYVLGRNKAGTLKLSEDELGLAIEIDPPDTQFARDLIESMNRGDINQMSFGFVTVRDSWNYQQDDKKPKEVVRTLQEVRLFDISPVTFPAYNSTSVAVRDYLSSLKEKEEVKVVMPDYSTLRFKMK
jgi:HK97 family phage prohead protease